MAFQKGEVMAIKWKGKKDVCLMRNIYDTSMISFKNNKYEDIYKPKLVVDNNVTMSSVDCCDQETSFIPTIRKRKKNIIKRYCYIYWTKLFETTFCPIKM